MIAAILMSISNEEQRNAISAIYEKYYNQMVRVANSILNNINDAEDAVMDTFRKMCEKPELFEDYTKKEVIGLIFICTKNTAKDYYRKNKHKDITFSQLEKYSEKEAENLFSDPNEDLDALIVSKETAETIGKAIDDLGETYRDIVLLKYVNQMRNTDIAVLLSLDVTTVNNRLFRAKNILHDKLIKQGVIVND